MMRGPFECQILLYNFVTILRICEMFSKFMVVLEVMWKFL